MSTGHRETNDRDGNRQADDRDRPGHDLASDQRPESDRLGEEQDECPVLLLARQQVVAHREDDQGKERDHDESKIKSSCEQMNRILNLVP